MARELSLQEQVAKEVAAAKRRELEELLAWQLKAMKLPSPKREFRFHPTRMWRVDFAWTEFMVVVEIEGLTHQGGRHQRIAGFEADAEKYMALERAGYKLLRLTPRLVRSGKGVRWINDVLEDESKKRGLHT
jgi:very-short-patch-repair endonuclease